MLIEITDFSIEQHQGDYESWPLKSRLFYQGQYTGSKVPGFVIERQYRYKNHYLLILSYDCPFEEANEFILLDQKFKLLAKKSLCVPYESFLIEDVKIHGDNELIIKYYDESYMRLMIQPDLRGLFKKKIQYIACDGFDDD